MRKIRHIIIHLLAVLMLLHFSYFSFSQIDTIPGLVLWLKADSGITKDTNNKVSQWNDFSGNGYFFSQPDSNKQPLYISHIDSLNNNPAVQLHNSQLTLNQNILIGTIFILVNFNADAFSFNAGLLTRIGVVDGTSDYFLVSNTSGTSFYGSILGQNLYMNHQQTYDFSPLKRFKIIRGFLSTPVTWSDMAIGLDRSLGGRFWEGEIFEVIIYNRNLQADEVTQVENYLMVKYVPPVLLPNDTTLSSFCPFTIKPKGYFTGYQWSTGETTDSIVVEHSGYYSITATDIFGRQSKDSIYVKFPENSFSSNELLCLHDSIILQTGLTYPAYHFLWQNNDTTPYFMVHIPGPYFVHITDSMGCTHFSDTIHVQYDHFSFENILPDTVHICIGDTLSAYHPQATVYNWSTGTDEYFILPNITDIYYVTATNTHGCKLIDSCYVNMKGVKPHPQIQTYNLCNNRQSQYTGSSTGNIILWQWTLQDSLSFTGQNIQHLYTNPDIYHTILHVVDSNTCEGYAFSTDTIHESPMAAFSYNTGCLGQNVLFSSQAHCNDNVISYYWSIEQNLFSGNSVSTNLNIGTHLVKHWITSEFGCSDTTMTNINIPDSDVLVQADANFPSQGMNYTNNPVVFSWNNHGQISFIEISLVSDFSQIFVQSSKSMSHQYTAFSLPLDTTIYWRICTFDNCGDSIASSAYFFSRNELPGKIDLSLWLASDSGVVKDINNKISEWRDISGNNYVLKQTNSTLQPSFAPFIDSLNYKPSIRLDNSQLTLNQNILIGTIFILVNFNADAFSFNAGLLTRIGVVDGTSDYFLVSNTSGTSFYGSILGQNLFINNLQTYDFAPLTRAKIIKGILSQTTNWDDLAIGEDRSIEGRFWKGDLFEVIIYNRDLTTIEANLVESYLMDKYAPPVLLPDDTVLTSFCPFTIKPKGYYTNYLWSTSEISESIMAVRSGYYKVTATDIFGRQSNDSIYVKFPDAGFVQITPVCAGDSVLITSALGNVVTYLWSNGNTSNHDYLKNENWYFVTITDAFSCSAVDSFFIDVDSLSLYPLFSTDTVHLCTGNLLTINPSSFPIESYLWFPSQDTAPYTEIQQSAWYSVMVADIIGCNKQDSVWVDVLGKAPVVQFNSSHTCFGDSTAFTDMSYSQDTSIINYWQWVIDNTDTIYTQNTLYLFNTYGNHNIQLTTGTNAGCYQQKEQNIVVFPLPTSDFSVLGFCQRQPTQFTQHSSIPFGNITGFHWIFDDGNEAYQENPVHFYQNYNNYNVTLITQSDEGCTDTLTKQIEIKYSPQAGFDVSPSCTNNPTFFADTSKTLNFFPIMQWLWYFGDGANSTSQNPAHVYTSEGTYNVQLNIHILNGCTDMISKSITVSSKPQAAFKTDSACAGQSMLLYDLSTISNGTLTSWTWYINNNFYSHDQNTSIVPSQEGTLPVMLIAESNTYCSDTAYKLLHVYPKPLVSFDAQPLYGAVPLTVNFENLSEWGTSLWKFGDGTTSLLLNPTHIYQDTGIFLSTLILTTLHGCTDSLIKSIMVVPDIVDLAVLQVTFTESNSFISIAAQIANMGTIPLVNPMLTFYTDKQHPIVEIVDTTLYSSQTFIYNFNGKIPLSYEVPSYICVTGNLSQSLTETTLQNNTSCVVIKNQDAFFNLYPNPVSEKLNILYQLSETQEIKVQLVNAIGQQILNQTINANKDFNQLNIDVSGLSQGVYTILIHTQNTTFNKMFIKE